MADKKRIKIGDTEEIRKDERTKSEIQMTDSKEALIAERKRGKSLVSRRSLRLLDKIKKDDKPKNFKDFLADEVKPFRFLSTHFPHYQDHYQYPGFVPFVKRQISETLLLSVSQKLLFMI